MFKSDSLEDALTYSHTIDNQQAVFVEWNLNQSYNIEKVGNYRYRPGTTDPKYGVIRSLYEPEDLGGFYTGATDSDIIINAGFDDSNDPAFYIAPKRKMNLLYSLDDCFKQNRPRSGINKLLYLGIVGTSSGYNQYVDSLSSNRPRYYMSSRYDEFKYWTSYRTEVEDGSTIEFGIALNSGTGTANQSYYIYDSAPFVVYKESVPANRVVVKVQTNVGTADNGPYRVGNNTNVPDPLYGEANKTIPKRWAIQSLDSENNWVEIISFDENDTRSNGLPIISSDGHVEIEYGLTIPILFQDVFTFAGEISSITMRPELAPYGQAYLYKTSETDMGVLYISDGAAWQAFSPEYGWNLSEIEITKNTNVVKKLSNPDYFIDNGEKVFREFQFTKGLRVVVDTMNKVNSTFDLIELSPRLVSDITGKASNFSVRKTLSDLGTYSMPTGNLLASTGSITLFDDDLSFNENNLFNLETGTGSIISQYSNSKIKFLFYDIVKNINDYDYYIPIKTLYSERIPQVSDGAATISMELRDLFYFFESKKSPELLLTNVSLSYAVMVLLDNIGFSNYIFKRTEGEEELIIPFFFVGPDQNIAETLQQLAISSQSAMFFDEYNNLVVMSKDYILPSEQQRETDLVFYGQEELVGSKTALPNIMNISSQDKLVYNGGEINYTTRYIQKSIGSIAQAPYIDDYKTFVYKPVLLWEVAGQQSTKTINEAATEASGYSLAAMPLKTRLTDSIPEVVDGTIVNNVIDFGESVYWLGNYSGYFYSNGEVIRYDASEYSVAGVGNVWIKNNQEYQKYFANLRFNGKMYPTGRIRIFASVQNDVVQEHGRGQFGTEIVDHPSGLDDNSPWINDTNVRGSIQNSKEYLFNTNRTISYPKNTGIEEAGNSKTISGRPYTSQSYAIKSTRNGIIKNFMANTNITENDVNYYKTARSGSVQTSALVFNGPDIPSEIDPAEFVTYAYKSLDKPYKHFGTRLRIIGKVESATNQDQTSLGAFTIYSPSELSSGDPSKQVSIKGGSGGIAFGLNKDTNVGYYFEIAALSQSNVSSYTNNSNYSSYQIIKSPIITVVNDLVTVSLDSQHDFEVGTTVIVSGVVDDNRKTRPTSINGEYAVTAISTDRKQFTYNIKQPDFTTANITGVSRTGSGSSWTITYTASNNFRSGMIVNVSGLAPSGYNLTGAVVESANEKSFTVFSTTDPGTVTDATGAATYVVLSTTSSNGGTVKRVLDSDTLISNIFFYKIVSGSNTADIIKKQRTETLVTLTTLRDHSLDVGEQIVVSDIDSTLNGLWEISSVTPRTIQFNTISSGTIVESDLDPIGLVTGVNKIAIPEVLWRGMTDILVDDGKFTSQSRLTTSEKTTVYDLSAEYLDIGTTRQFFLYLDNKQIAVVNDTSPLPQYNNVALFVRGSSRVMFENIYALSDNFAENTARALQLPISKIFGDELITESEAIKKYAISGMVQNTYLSGISSENPPKYSMYYEEFGTIMREAAYFNIRYDRAYPALYAKLAETLNRVRGYTVSGFMAGSYGAEFLIFNAIDKNLNLDDTTGNYLRILGIAFTQNTTHSLKVDDFFNKNSNFAEQLYSGGTDAADYQRLYTDVLNSRNKYGNNEFSIETQYVQTDAAAESMMDWIVKKIIHPRKTVGISAFGVPHLQLGDIVQVNYNDESINIICSPETRFVVYNIEYSRDSGQTSTTVHLAEV